jgi:hypothetical protein
MKAHDALVIIVNKRKEKDEQEIPTTRSTLLRLELNVVAA